MLKMKQNTVNELIVAILLIGFVIVIAQNQMILNSLTTEAPVEEGVIDRLMALPEMQEFIGYEGAMEYLTLEQVQSLAEQYPDVYGNINKAIYQIQLTGEKNVIVLYDDVEQKILNIFELMNAEVGQ